MKKYKFFIDITYLIYLILFYLFLLLFLTEYYNLIGYIPFFSLS